MDNSLLVITIDDADGEIGCLYTDDIGFSDIGCLNVRRASHIKFDNVVQKWTVVLVDGTNLGYFKTRKDALTAEVGYLNRRIADGTIEEVFQ